MENIKYYYISHECEPLIVVLKNETIAFVNEYNFNDSNIEDISSITDLDEIISESIDEGYSGSWEDIKFLIDMEEKEFLDEVFNNTEVIADIKIDFNNFLLVERFTKRFSKMSTSVGQKFLQQYKDGQIYINSLSESELSLIVKETENFNNKEFLYFILNKTNSTIEKRDEKYFHF
jgi:hypothetical protein